MVGVDAGPDEQFGAGSGAGHAAHGGKLLLSHGGAIEKATKVYLVYWGAAWSTGFSTGTSRTGVYSSSTAQTYIQNFFGTVGGSSWIGTDTQYCQGVPSSTTDCSQYSSADYITNPTGQLAGTWTDTTHPIPSSLQDSDIAQEALVAESHFGGYNANATYLIFTPTGQSESGFGTSWCAWHWATSDANGNTVAFGYIPYQPDAGSTCGMNFVNGTNTAYGNGYFDGFSIVAGHEYEEAQTDPDTSTGWYDASGAEDADKCAWSSLSNNISLGSHSYAVQPVWSNRAGGCVPVA